MSVSLYYFFWQTVIYSLLLLTTLIFFLRQNSNLSIVFPLCLSAFFFLYLRPSHALTADGIFFYRDDNVPLT